ncbi:MAG: hypothetical protein C0401_00945, partial [Anaerolinea sp.]|nr:hypothetical protein [Anaerolinea sp.]
MKSNNKLTTLITSCVSSLRIQKYFLGGAAAVVSGIFIGIGFIRYKPGFPLDDSWIHQTYAKNLVLYGRWEYIPGEISAGSTSPIWTLILSIGNLLGFKTPFFWTTFISVIFFVCLVLTAFEIVKNKKPELLGYSFLAGSAILLEWHLLWSVASGMETVLFSLLIVLVFLLLNIQKPKWILLGLLTGLLVWVRPDGITVLGPILLIFLYKGITKKIKFINLITFFIPLILLIGTYGWFNFGISGKLFPNTFYAKQIEYAILLSQPLLIRIYNVFSVLISGAGVLLVPGFIWAGKNAIVKRDFWKIGVILWIIGYGLLYVFRLPVVYQHGRYLFPLIPMFVVVGICGTSELIEWLKSRKNTREHFKTIFFGSVLVCSLIFVSSGEKAYIKDLQTIDQLMVQPALWIKNNTNQTSVIAAHDIGALGYYSDRKIIDLAGLI